MTTQNWESLGITWEQGTTVSRGVGNDRAEIGYAEIPRLASLDVASKAGLGESILAGVNGTSWRVSAQDVARAYIEQLMAANERDADGKIFRKMSRYTPEQVERLRERAFNRIKGLRNASGGTRVVEKKVRVLPNGKVGPEVESEFRAELAATLVDLGMETEKALAAAEAYSW